MKDGYYVVKPWSLMVGQYGLDKGVIDCACWFTKNMEEKVPKGRVIQVVDNRWEGFLMSDDMFMGPYLEYGEKCLVRDNIVSEWRERHFVTYRPGTMLPIVVKNGEDLYRGTETYRHVKKIGTPAEIRQKVQKVFDEKRKLIGYLVRWI